MMHTLPLYILKILGTLVKTHNQDRKRKKILVLLVTETQLRSEKELIERFIATHFADIPKDGDICEAFEAFEAFWNAEKIKALQPPSQCEGLDPEGLQKIIGDYLFSEKTPLRDNIVAIMHKRPGLKEGKFGDGTQYQQNREVC